MADVTSANVTLNRAWTEGGTHGKDRVALNVTIAATAAGGTTAGNQIPASAFGLVVIEEAGLFVASNNGNVYQASPSFDGTLLLIADSENAAAGSHNNSFGAAGITDTIKGTIHGWR